MADENRQDSLAVEAPVDQAALRNQFALQEEQDEDLALAMQGLDEDSLSDEYKPDEALVSDQPSGDVPTTDVAPTEEQGLADTVKAAAEEQVEQKVDVIEDAMTYKGNYQNVLARVLDIAPDNAGVRVQLLQNEWAKKAAHCQQRGIDCRERQLYSGTGRRDSAFD